jgi:hypothetical protein
VELSSHLEWRDLSYSRALALVVEPRDDLREEGDESVVKQGYMLMRRQFTVLAQRPFQMR